MTPQSHLAQPQHQSGLFTTDGRQYDLFRPAESAPLPAATFVLRAAPMRGFYLDKVEDLPVPERIYGARRDERILDSYYQRAKEGTSTGVWLNGEKGSGKTMLASVLSDRMRKQGLATILVQNDYVGAEFNTVIEHIGRACWIFDEFEKVYREDAHKDAMLTVFAGAVVAQNLYVLTTNDAYKVSEAMRNRPSRMRYFIEYRGVPEDVVKEFVKHRMTSEQHHAPMIRALSNIPECNFDIMQCAVEEHNRFGGEIEELLGIMNISRQIDAKWKVHYKGTVHRGGGIARDRVIEGKAEWSGDLYSLIDNGFSDHDGDRPGFRIRFSVPRLAPVPMPMPNAVRDKSARSKAATAMAATASDLVAMVDDGNGHGTETFDWCLTIGEGSAATYGLDGSISITTDDNSDGRGVLTFRRVNAFSNFRQRF